MRSGLPAPQRRYLWRVAEVAALLVLVALVVAVFAWALKYILPFVIGWLLAVMLLPIVRWLEHHGVKRTTAAIVVMVVVAGIIALLSTYAFVALIRETASLSKNSAHSFAQVDRFIRHQVHVGQNLFGVLPKNVAVDLQSSLIQMLQSAEVTVRHFASGLMGFVTHLPETLFVIVIAVIAAFFMLVHRERMVIRTLAALPPGWEGKVKVAGTAMLRALVGTIRVQLLLMLISAVLGVIGMKLLQIPYAIILGIVFGLTGLIPIVGSALLTVPWAIGALVIGDVSMAIKVLLLQAVISLIRHSIEPKILADNVGLDMLSTLFALYVGMKSMGVIGLFLGPILLIGIKSLITARMFVDFLPGDALAQESFTGTEETSGGPSRVGPAEGVNPARDVEAERS